jgi:hypothetical protein
VVAVWGSCGWFELTLIPPLVRAVPVGDTVRAAVLSRHPRLVLGGLRGGAAVSAPIVQQQRQVPVVGRGALAGRQQVEPAAVTKSPR